MIIRCVTPSGRFSSGFSEDDHRGCRQWAVGSGGFVADLCLMSRNAIFGDIIPPDGGCRECTEVRMTNDEVRKEWHAWKLSPQSAGTRLRLVMGKPVASALRLVGRATKKMGRGSGTLAGVPLLGGGSSNGPFESLTDRGDEPTARCRTSSAPTCWDRVCFSYTCILSVWPEKASAKFKSFSDRRNSVVACEVAVQ
jgi:hypothetical protein